MSTQANKPNNRVFLLMGIVLAALAFGGVLFALRQSSSANSVSVVVATKAIAANTTLTADVLSVQSVPQAAAASNAYTAVTAVVGKTTTIPVAQGTQILPTFFTAQPLAAQTIAGPGTAANTPVSLEGLITKGFVALAIPTSSSVPPGDTVASNGGSALGADLVSAGGYIQAGDHIDIVVNTGAASGGARYSFQDVPVLRVGSASGGGGILIVEVPRNQAELLTQLTVGPTQPFVVKYVLRPQAEWGKLAPDNSSYAPNYENASGPSVPTTQDSTVTPQTLSSLFGG